MIALHILLAALTTAAPATPPNGWTRFRGDAAQTGVARGALPKALALLWTYEGASAIYSTAAIANGRVFVGDEAGAAYPSKPLEDGQTLAVGQALVKFIEKPGRTPDSVQVFPAHGTGSPGGTAKRVVKLAEPISSAELKRILVDLPDTFRLVDIRPPAQFADYHLPGSMNVDIGNLIDNPAFLNGAGPLVIVDRDGSLAMMVAGILSQKTSRPIKALFGGLEAYWDEAGPGAAVSPAAMPSLPAASGAVPASSRPAARPKKKKSAGC